MVWLIFLYSIFSKLRIKEFIKIVKLLLVALTINGLTAGQSGISFNAASQVTTNEC